MLSLKDRHEGKDLISKTGRRILRVFGLGVSQSVTEIICLPSEKSLLETNKGNLFTEKAVWLWLMPKEVGLE